MRRCKQYNCYTKDEKVVFALGVPAGMALFAIGISALAGANLAEVIAFGILFFLITFFVAIIQTTNMDNCPKGREE